MMSLEAVSDFFRSFWGLWLMLIFTGIIVWALWPSRRRSAEMQDHADIPFRDDKDSL
ncbi:MAG: cbb3-type cytochrome c oxidase subunit 3 [Rhodospirillaceae bacterium]|jgi:cytochrome c oxidase cbb3-type subunit IV|nr:cbb3-type cytochrome c oxidase subunit 3 [Rhodospirillaceae bacterium]MBT5375076.1 cbb3-type cytochrome c oxidase subunit 3 [Rhodospirillaceae bacterium]MBT5658988.1 cbb3-type cytochrome c oxidase subunit 3 [Rhodospirillaceae bacterium]MBT5752435.1 cbb3-type cytochrome c oxidase subunit 3 [Rhodospirillaceae bacterium]